jgi:hypothetical protein
MEFEISLNEFKGPFNIERTLGSQQCPSDFWQKSENGYITFVKIKEKWLKIAVTPGRDYLLINASNNANEV